MYMITFHSVDLRENKGTKTWLSLSIAASSYHSWKLPGDRWSFCGLNIILLNPVLRRFSRFKLIYEIKLNISSTKLNGEKFQRAKKYNFLKFNGIPKKHIPGCFGTYDCCISAPSFTLSILFLYFRKNVAGKCAWEIIYRIETRGWFIPPETFTAFFCF